MFKHLLKRLTSTVKNPLHALVILLSSPQVIATAPNSPEIMQQEIQHLLNFVAATACQYERNGTLHSGKEAKKHIIKKYRYFEDDITTTEKFIKFAATKSKMSGQFYYIHCPNQAKVKSKDWLLTELRQYRAVSK